MRSVGFVVLQHRLQHKDVLLNQLAFSQGKALLQNSMFQLPNRNVSRGILVTQKRALET